MRTDRLNRKRTPFIPAPGGASWVVVAVMVAKPNNAIPFRNVFRNFICGETNPSDWCLLIPTSRDSAIIFSTIWSTSFGGSMKNLFQREAIDEVIARIDNLQPATQRQWGKMDVAQMMAHCSAALDMANGQLIL